MPDALLYFSVGTLQAVFVVAYIKRRMALFQRLLREPDFDHHVIRLGFIRVLIAEW
jgi:hypothetical protein